MIIDSIIYHFHRKYCHIPVTHNASWYDTGMGRFISEDPDRNGANWYVYVSNNQLECIDPIGMKIEVTL